MIVIEHYEELVILTTASSFVPTNSVPLNDVQPRITRFYPNPASSFINFEFQRSLEKGYVLQLYNFIGKKVSEIAVTNNKLIIPLDGFFRGIYIFQLRDKNGKIIESGKFQIVK